MLLLQAEREARIALERANMGETESEMEQKKIEEKLERLSFVIHDIPPDGHCMFRAVEDQVSHEVINASKSDGISIACISKHLKSWIWEQANHLYGP